MTSAHLLSKPNNKISPARWLFSSLAHPPSATPFQTTCRTHRCVWTKRMAAQAQVQGATVCREELLCSTGVLLQCHSHKKATPGLLPLPSPPPQQCAVASYYVHCAQTWRSCVLGLPARSAQLYYLLGGWRPGRHPGLQCLDDFPHKAPLSMSPRCLLCVQKLSHFLALYGRTTMVVGLL